MNQENSITKESFTKIGLLGAALVIFLIGLTLGARGLAAAWSLGPGGAIIFSGVLPALLVIAATAGIEKLLSARRWAECLESIGLGRPHFGQLKASALCLLPIAVAYLGMIFAFGISLTAQANLPWLIIKIFVSQGIGEEVVFRGLVFRHLRSGRSFWRAATLSAAVFSIVHLAGLLRGFSVGNLFDVAISIGFSFLMGYAMAHLFEAGGGTIWGCTLLHVGIDSTNWFSGAGDTQFSPGNIVYMLGIIVASGMAFWAILRTPPETQRLCDNV